MKPVLILPLLLGAWATAQAASLDVQVVDRDDRQPLSGAAICLGTTANPTQFGAQRADSYGRVSYRELPEAPLVLTVSSAGYRGHSSQHRLRGFDLRLEVPLPSGGLGPVCELSAEDAAGQQPASSDEAWLAVETVSVMPDTDDPQTLQLQLSARGEPTHYRVAESASLGDSRWQPYLDQILYRKGEQTPAALYLQLRRYHGDEGAAVERLSAVRRVPLY